MNRIELTNLGGFPLEQDTLKFMQDSYGDLFTAIARLAGDKTIISGVQVNNGQVSDGWISYGGELLKFVGGAAGAGVVIQETAGNALFEDGSTKGVYKTRVATIGTPATFPFADLLRVDTLAALWAKVNKPAAYISYTGAYNLGDIGNQATTNDTIVTIYIPDQSSTNYIVAGSLVGANANADMDNDVMWIVSAKQSGSFKLAIREVTPAAQNLKFEFAIIQMF